MNTFELALARAGQKSLVDFQRANGLVPTNMPDAATIAMLGPYMLGTRMVRIAPGDTYYKLAHENGTTVRAILTANPGQDPNSLEIGRYIAVPLSFPVVPTDIPFTYEILCLCIQGLAVRYPFLTVKNIGTTANGREIPALALGDGNYRVLYNAAHHANEWITTPVLLHFLEQYCAAIAVGGRLFGFPAESLRHQTTLYAVPMVNPDGVDLVTGGIRPGTCEYRQAQALAGNYPDIPFPSGWKANLNGVDVNLNYPAGWEQAKQNKFALGYRLPGPRDYVGEAPLDQPETRAMTELTNTVQPNLTQSWHTQGEVIYWQFENYAPPEAEQLGSCFASVSGYALSLTPYDSGFAGYKDWFLQTYRRPGYTIEAGQGENPVPLSQFDAIYRAAVGILAFGLTPETCQFTP